MERKIVCVAIDDEPIALSIISQFCKRLGNIDLDTYSDPQEGLHAILAKNPDIVLLDIEMKDINGLSIAKKIGDKTVFIFTTAYLKYALDGFDLDAADFLHKPFSFDRFRTAMEKAERRLEYRETVDAKNHTIIVKQEYANVLIRVSDIEYIEAMENYAKIYLCSGNCIVSRSSMKNVMSLLPPADFIRIHRSYIIPVTKIAAFNKQSLKLYSGSTFPVGRQYVADLLERMATK